MAALEISEIFIALQKLKSLTYVGWVWAAIWKDFVKLSTSAVEFFYDRDLKEKAPNSLKALNSRSSESMYKQLRCISSKGNVRCDENESN